MHYIVPEIISPTEENFYPCVSRIRIRLREPLELTLAARPLTLGAGSHRIKSIR